MSDQYALLVDHAGYLVYRKTKVDFIDVDERWSEDELQMIKPCIIHLLNGGSRNGFDALSDKRRRQIEIRIATAFIDLESELRSYRFPCQSTDWFEYRLKEERKVRAAASKKAAKAE